MALVPGTVCLFIYDVDDDEAHERLVCGHVEGDEYVGATPEYDYYAELYSVNNPDLDGLRFYGPGGALPVGLPVAHVHGFPALGQGDRTQILLEGHLLATQLRAARGLPALRAPTVAPGIGIRRPALVSPPLGRAPPVGKAPVVAVDALAASSAVVPGILAPPPIVVVGENAFGVLPSSDGPALLGGGVAPVGFRWIALEDASDGEIKFGDAIVFSAGGSVLQTSYRRRGIATTVRGEDLVVGLVLVSEADGVIAGWRGSDARTMPVKRVGGIRRREWVEVCRDSRLEVFADFEVPGVRSTPFCLQFMLKAGGPRMHFETWKARRRLGFTDWGVDTYELLCDILESFSCFDQIDPANSAAIEKVCRRMQMIEYFHDDRAAEARPGDDRIPIDEFRAFTGGGRPNSMVDPGLMDQVTKELDRIGVYKKNARKLREEKAAEKTNRNKDKGKGKGVAE